jgi:apolipoprotein N-acyltransferase
MVSYETAKQAERNLVNKIPKVRSSRERVLFQFCLAITSGILLGLSFPPSPFYSLAYVAFIPWMYLFAFFDSYSQILKYSYLFLLVFHLFTVYWTGGFTVGKDLWMMTAGAAVIVLHPIFFLPFILSSFFVRKKLGLVYGSISFALFWTSFEYLHSLGEYSFPWLTLGNSQAYDINRIQILEYSSIYGLSLLILTFNILAFLLFWNTAKGNWKLRSFSAFSTIVVLLVLYFGPVFYGSKMRDKEMIHSERNLRVGIIQPNFDPWDKWGEGSGAKLDSYMAQFNSFIDETKKLAQYKPDLILWPETAIPFHILLPRYAVPLSILQSLIDSIQLPVFTGLPTIEYFDSLNAPATSQKIGGTNFYAESYNSAIFLQPHHILGPVHKKTVLVPFAERIPYAGTFRFLIEPLKWNVGISSWGKGEDTIVYSFLLKKGIESKFSGMICYESAYPNYVREFVNRGAEFLVVLTNDSWWGNTSGAYQHASFASLRAVETRRWVVQCANGGISMIVDPTGTAHWATSLYSKAQFIGTIGLRSETTFYVNHGDIVAQICIAGSAMMLLGAIMRRKNKGNLNGLD